MDRESGSPDDPARQRRRELLELSGSISSNAGFAVLVAGAVWWLIHQRISGWLVALAIVLTMGAAGYLGVRWERGRRERDVRARLDAAAREAQQQLAAAARDAETRLAEAEREWQEKLDAARKEADAASDYVESNVRYHRHLNQFAIFLRASWEELCANPSASQEKREEKIAERLDRARNAVYIALTSGLRSAGADDDIVRVAYLTPIDENDEHYLCAQGRHHYGFSSLRIEERRFYRRRGSLAGIAWEEKKAQYASDAKNDDRLQRFEGDDDSNLGSLYCVPAFDMTGRERVGVLCVSSSRPRGFRAVDQEFAKLCATILSLIETLAEQREVAD
jgi:GAF domain